MKKGLLFSIFYIHAIIAICQPRDTVRVYNYENGSGFSLTTKNNKAFTFIHNLYRDTLKGQIIGKGNRYMLITDTSLLDKRQKRASIGIRNSIWLEIHPIANTPFLHISHDTMQRLHLDTAKLSDVILGKYLVSTGHVGCRLQLEKDKVTILPFNDVGFNERKEVATWVKDNKGIKLQGKSYVDELFTDNKRFYVLPYFLVGRKVKVSKRTFTETVTYFVKSTH